MNLLQLSHTDVLAHLCPVRTYLEIGVQEGASLRAVVQASPTLEHLVVCDTWGGMYGGTARGSNAHIVTLLQELHYGERVDYLNGPSQQLLPPFLKDVPPKYFDLVFIDGDHSAAGAAEDIRNVWPVAKTLAIHDLVFPEVWEAVVAWLPSADQLQSVQITSVHHNLLVIAQ